MRSSIFASAAIAAATAVTAWKVPHVIGDRDTKEREAEIAKHVKTWAREPQTAGFGITPLMAGFQNAAVRPSLGGHATCIQGFIPVTASAANQNLNISGPANIYDLSNTAVQYVQIASTLPTNALTGPNQVSGTYKISCKMCFPTNGINTNLPLQFLIHGVGFDKNYWDFYSSQYSYVDYMAKAGYTTFSYDRLGVGLSDHPDPLAVVQSPLELSIAHSLIQMLRSAKVGSTLFKRIVGVGHSFGSIQVNGLTKSYPADLDGAVLTGFSTSQAGVGTFLSALNLDIAASNQPQRFNGLANGYTVSSTQISNQMCFFRYPNFDPAVLAQAESSKGSFALGELFTLGAIAGQAPAFTGPVDVVLGQNDLPFCQSDCMQPSNQGDLALTELYPARASRSQSFLVPGVGHGINLHYAAGQAYDQIAAFLKSNGM